MSARESRDKKEMERFAPVQKAEKAKNVIHEVRVIFPKFKMRLDRDGFLASPIDVALPNGQEFKRGGLSALAPAPARDHGRPMCNATHFQHRPVECSQCPS